MKSRTISILAVIFLFAAVLLFSLFADSAAWAKTGALVFAAVSTALQIYNLIRQEKDAAHQKETAFAITGLFSDIPEPEWFFKSSEDLPEAASDYSLIFSEREGKTGAIFIPFLLLPKTAANAKKAVHFPIGLELSATGCQTVTRLSFPQIKITVFSEDGNINMCRDMSSTEAYIDRSTNVSTPLRIILVPFVDPEYLNSRFHITLSVTMENISGERKNHTDELRTRLFWQKGKLLRIDDEVV